MRKNLNKYVKDIRNGALGDNEKIKPYLITTRFDNDDCLHREAVDNIQGHFHGQDYEVLNFSKGYCLQIEPVMRLSSYIYPKGPFVSIIRNLLLSREDKKKYNVRGVFGSHTRFVSEGPVTQIDDKYYWVQVIHDTNLQNTLRGKLSLNKKVLTDFGIDNNRIRLSLTDYIRENIKRGFPGETYP